MKKTIYFLILIIFLSSLSAAYDHQSEAERKGFEIMLKNYEQMTTRNWRSDVVMQLIDRKGKVQTRHLKRLSKTGTDDQEKYFLRFIDPPTIRNTTLLITEHKDRDDDVWFFLPAIKKIKRMSGGNMRTSYMGTEFSFKDIKREKVDPKDNRYVLVNKELINDIEHYVVDAFPVSSEEKSEQGYARRRLWLRSDNYLVSRIHFWDEDGEFLKDLIASDIRQVGQSGNVRYFHFVMTNRKGVKTVLKFQLLRINEDDPDEKYFTKTFLLQNQ